MSATIQQAPIAPAPRKSREPMLAEFFDPDPASLIGPEPKPKALGPARIELGRMGPRRYRLLRRFGYRDPKSGKTFVMPRKLDEWTTDLSSNPTLFSWVVPVLGSHFNAILVHDALVEGTIYDPAIVGQQGDGYIGEKVSREDADSITRDAMGEQGTGFLRRWIAWGGMAAATTLFSPEGTGGKKRKKIYRAALWIHLIVIAALGVYSTGEVLGLYNNLPWMSGQGWFVRLVLGLLAAVIVPIVMSIPWWKRAQLPLVLGLVLAPLLPALVVTVLLSVTYLIAEHLLSKKFGRENAATLPILAFGQRDNP